MRRGLTVCEADVCMKILGRMKEQTVFGNDLLRKRMGKQSKFLLAGDSELSPFRKSAFSPYPRNILKRKNMPYAE
jgi:hypothetical protein